MSHGTSNYPSNSEGILKQLSFYKTNNLGNIDKSLWGVSKDLFQCGWMPLAASANVGGELKHIFGGGRGE